MVENIGNIIGCMFLLIMACIGVLTALAIAVSLTANVCVDAFIDIQKKIEEITKNE